MLMAPCWSRCRRLKSPRLQMSPDLAEAVSAEGVPKDPVAPGDLMGRVGPEARGRVALAVGQVEADLAEDMDRLARAQSQLRMI